MLTKNVLIENLKPLDDEDELRRLVRAIKLSKKNYLFFVCCNQVPRQNKLIAEAKKILKSDKIKIAKFKHAITDLLTELQDSAIGDNPQAIFVQGLEYSISSDGKGDENTLIHNLNVSRDSFKKYLSYPLFLWIPEYVLVKIARHAPDFFSIRSGIFYFSDTPEKVIEQVFRNLSSSWTRNASLGSDDKRKQIKELGSLLAEYRGLHREKQDKTSEIRLVQTIGSLYESLSEYKNAITQYKKALKISKDFHNESGKGSSLLLLGNIYRNLGNYNKAAHHLKESLKIARKLGNRLGEGSSLGNLGSVYQNLGKYKEAIRSHEQALEIFRETANRSGEGYALMNLGNVYGSLRDYEKAIGFFEQSLEISKKLGDRWGEELNLLNLGNAYDGLTDSLTAIKNYRESLSISREIGNRMGESASLGGLANTYHALREYRKAVEFYEKSIKVSREIGDLNSEGTSLSNLGNTYWNLGEKSLACDCWKASLEIFQKIGSPNINFVQERIEQNEC